MAPKTYKLAKLYHGEVNYPLCNHYHRDLALHIFFKWVRSVPFVQCAFRATPGVTGDPSGRQRPRYLWPSHVGVRTVAVQTFIHSVIVIFIEILSPLFSSLSISIK